MKIDINLIGNKKRKAIAMIELIFAIVIIGITLLSVPLMVNQASQSTYTTIQQEAISAAASEINIILVKAWDEADTNDSYDPTILRTASTNYAVRNNAKSRTYDTDNPILDASTTLGADSGDLDDIDDYHNTNILVDDTDGSDLLDQTMTIATTVTYLNDGFTSPIGTSAGGTSNIKGITITLTSGVGGPTELIKTIKLHAFSCNIGSPELKKEPF